MRNFQIEGNNVILEKTKGSMTDLGLKQKQLITQRSIKQNHINYCCIGIKPPKFKNLRTQNCKSPILKRSKYTPSILPFFLLVTS